MKKKGEQMLSITPKLHERLKAQADKNKRSMRGQLDVMLTKAEKEGK